jgi:hypothetical protein
MASFGSLGRAIHYTREVPINCLSFRLRAICPESVQVRKVTTCGNGLVKLGALGANRL